MGTMKRYIARLIFVVALPIAAAAQMRTSYFMEGSTFRTDMNPALAPTRGYINIPIIGGMSMGLNNNFLSIDNLLYPTEDGLVTFMHKSVDRNDFLARLPKNNNLGISLSDQIVGFGAHTKRFFWSFGLNMKVNADVNIPKDFFALVTSLGQGTYSMKGMSVGLSSYMEAYLGAAIPIKEIATFGFRVKGLVGVANAVANIDNTTVNVADDEVSARLSGQLTGCCAAVNGNLPEGEAVEMGEIIATEIVMDDLLSNMGNGGVAVDLGAEVRLLNENLRISAAVTDLGFISWKESAVVRGEFGGSVSYEGVDLETMEPKISQEELQFLGAGSQGGYLQRLNCSVNVGAEYAILRNHISFGLLSHTQFFRSCAFSELTASVNFRPANWFSATVSHTFLNKNQPGVFGFGLNLHPAGLNIFLGADFIDLKFAQMNSEALDATLLLPVRQRSVNLNFGLGFSLGRAKYSSAYKADMAHKQAKKAARK